GIRDWSVTGVQTCALPISEGTEKALFLDPDHADIVSADLARLQFSQGGALLARFKVLAHVGWSHALLSGTVAEGGIGHEHHVIEIGRASGRERGDVRGVDG